MAKYSNVFYHAGWSTQDQLHCGGPCMIMDAY